MRYRLEVRLAAGDVGKKRGLTVWALAGRHSELRLDRKMFEHELPARPASERQAQAA